MKVPMGAFMPDRAFVPGSTDAKHKGELRVESFSFGLRYVMTG